MQKYSSYLDIFLDKKSYSDYNPPIEYDLLFWLSDQALVFMKAITVLLIFHTLNLRFFLMDTAETKVRESFLKKASKGESLFYV